MCMYVSRRWRRSVTIRRVRSAQYALREKAMELGWSDPAVQILDRDLGKSGAQITGREDFKTLVAEVSMGQVGAVFALEVSRLARSNLDWHRLLELCALTDTLVIDEDGCYNPADFNDGLRREGLASKSCMSFRCDLLDAAIAEQVLQALQPAELELAPAALEELEARDHTLGRQWQMRLERAEYEAALAERRYQEVDPSQRLVAATLERRWNAALMQLEELRKQAAEFQRQQARVATPEQKAKVLALAKDLPQLWHAPTTQAKDRKRMLRLLIKDITVEKSSVPKQLLVHIRWQGNACTDLTLQLPPNIADRVRYPAAIVDRIRDMAHHLHDAEIADQFRQEGYSSAKGRPYTAKIIQWIRFRYRIPPPALQKPEELTVHQVARYFGVSENVVYYWIEHALLQTRKLNAGSPYWITLNGTDEQKLRDWVHNSSRIHPTSSTLTEEGAL